MKLLKISKKIDSDEFKFLKKIKTEIDNAVPISCTYCGYCVKECSESIPIPEFFNMYNNEKMFPLESTESLYMLTSQSKASPLDCSECGVCIDYCTQQLNIPDLLKDVVDLFQ